ncbi:MAG: nucleotidyltransferase domain-containing protein [Actinobacteria bacterium]|nr:nucleotidyltransferase domain-containing protein [Actinomycetota bacterium]
MTGPRIAVDRDRIEEFCRKWKITELAFFGSVLRDDFGPDSDVDVAVTFTDDARWGLFALVDMQEELAALFGRKVDLVTRKSVEQSDNYIRRRHVLENMETFYVA